MIVSKGLGDMDELFKDKKAGIVVSNKDPLDQIAAEIAALLVDPEVHLNCRNLAMEHFDMERAIIVYSNVYTKMLDKK